MMTEERKQKVRKETGLFRRKQDSARTEKETVGAVQGLAVPVQYIVDLGAWSFMNAMYLDSQ